LEFIDFIVQTFSTHYNEETKEHTYTLASILADHFSTVIFGITALRYFASASKQLRELQLDRFSVFSPALLNETRSSLPSSIIMFFSYLLSSLGMHVFSIFNTGEPTGRELYLSYVVMDSLTLVAILVTHAYMRLRYSFLSEVYCRFMILGSAMHLALYILIFYPPVSYNVSWDAIDIISATYIIVLQTASYLCAFACLFPTFSERKLVKLKRAISKRKTLLLDRCNIVQILKKRLKA